MILCNPHNPIGTIWNKETLTKIGELCLKHRVLVLSDEIHCDLILGEKQFIPFASCSAAIAQNSLTCIAPTKTFNLAGLQTSNIVILNEDIRKKVNERMLAERISTPNFFAIDATIAAYKDGGNWLDELLVYLKENKQFILNFIQEQLPRLKAINPQATYLMWINCASVTSDTSKMCRYLKDKAGLYLLEGAIYGENAKSFLRINYACPRERLADGLWRLKRGIESFEKEI